MRILTFIGYVAWFIVLVGILFLSTGNPSTNRAEILGAQTGLALALLVLSLIPYFIARHRARKSGLPISWAYVMAGTTMIALLLAVGGFYGRSKESHERLNIISTTELRGPEVRHDALPQTMKECIDAYATPASSMKNTEIIVGMCTTAFDPNSHPVDRVRSFCNVRGWTERANVDPVQVALKCNADNPTPSCPSGQSFQLHNKRCEVDCDAFGGFAPDSSGQRCVHVCPSGTMALYVGFATQCNDI